MATITRRIINSSLLPKPIGPFSGAVIADNTVYVSGHVGQDPKTGNVVQGGVAAEAKQALENVGQTLQAAGTDFKNVVKATVLLVDINDFDTVNKVYAKYFTSNHPARIAYQVAALPLGAKVEIDAIAVVGNVTTI